MKTLLEMLIESGYPKKEIYHHYSDLYIFATPETDKIIDIWCKQHNFNRRLHCSKFRDAVTGKPMFDCAFCYYDMEEDNDDN